MAEYREEKPKSEFEERVVSVDRISHTVQGGRRLRFRALVVIGNRQGRVGMGVAKAGEVATAVQKAVASAKKHLITIPLVNETIPHSIEVHYGSAHVLLKPAKAGTSVIAGGSVRAVIELAGIKNIRSKAIGSNNKINNVSATIQALQSLRHSTAAKPVVLQAAEAVQSTDEPAKEMVVASTKPRKEKAPKKTKETA